MRLLLALLALAACDRAAGDLPTVEVEPAPVPRPAVEPIAPPAPAKPAPAKLGALSRVSQYDNQTLCVEDAAGTRRCRRLELSRFDKAMAVTDAPPDTAIELTRDGAPCTYRDGALTCGKTVTPMTARHGGFLLYLTATDPSTGTTSVAWFEPARRGPSELHTMAPLPGGIVELDIGFRVGCARTGKDEIYCWSDPRKPQQLAMPGRIVEITLQDPFELCATTDRGELHCTAPFVQAKPLFCSKSTLACGTGEIEKRDLITSFDPLAMVKRPLRRVALSHRATGVEPDEDPIYQYCLDSLFVGETSAGACTMGAPGQVSCVSACRGTWRLGTVSGLPATVHRIWSEGRTGYALTTDGALWWWPRTRDCGGARNARATRIAGLPAIADLTEPLSLQTGPTSFEPLRCARTVGGEARCWQTDASGAPSNIVDPMR